jgi:hypothetical protein
MLGRFKKNAVIIFLGITLSVFMLGAAAFSASSGDTAAKEEPYEMGNQSFHNLSADGLFEFSEAIQSSEIYYAPSMLATNSHKITVANQGDTDLVVYLFSETDISEPIRQMTVASNDEEDFTGLTSRFLYTIGVSSDVPTQLELTITD